MKNKYVKPSIEIINISNDEILTFSFEISFDAFSEVFGGEDNA